MFDSGKRWLGLVIGVVASVGPAVAADITGPYVGIAAGGTGADFDAASRVYASTLSGTVTQRRDRDDVGGRLFAGYALNDHLAVEFSAGLLGTFQVDDRVGTQSLRNELNVGTLTLDVIGRWPVSDRFAVYAGAGPSYVKVKSEAITAGGVQLSPGTRAKRSDTRVVPHGRLGIAWMPNSKWEIRFETDAYFDIGERAGTSATGRSNANSLTVGVAYRF